jgi:hypothetical protein
MYNIHKKFDDLEEPSSQGNFQREVGALPREQMIIGIKVLTLA